ncbi:MAG: carbohydrate ABC transporter permease [Rubrobacteraceae bacterium]
MGERPKKPGGRAGGREGWLLVSPVVAVLLVMTVVPAIYLLYNSFFSFTLLSPQLKSFVGLANYAYVLTDPSIRNGLFITALFVVLAVGLETIIGLLLALALQRRTIGNTIASTLLLLPFAVTPVVSALLWRELLNPNYGWVDYYLQRIGLIGEPIEWLSSTTTAWVALVGLDVWQWTPFVALILMAGLQGIPQEPREAAAVDGATEWGMFWHVTLPLLRPFIAIAVLLRVVEAFKTFATVKVLTNGGPGTSTEIINLTLYRVGLQNFQIGAAAALGMVFLILLLILVSQLLRIIGRNTDLIEEG